MRYMNSIVIKLWLTILLIVTTVLIILSVALVMFFNSYLVSESALNLKKQAEKVELVLTSHHEQGESINYVKELIENPAGLILVQNKNDLLPSNEDDLKEVMKKQIFKNNHFQDVFKKDKFVTQEISVDYQGEKHHYILIGYPSQAFKSDDSGIFIYQDTESISSTFYYITIIIFAVALILLILTTIFAFFLSNRITKPLLSLKHAAFRIAIGEQVKKLPVSSRDEIGELTIAFNKMGEDINNSLNKISAERNLRDRLINSMIDGVLSFNMDLETQLENPAAKQFLEDITQDDSELLGQIVNDVILTGQTKYQEFNSPSKHYVVVVSTVKNHFKNVHGAVAIIRDMTEEERLNQMKQQFIANVSHELRTPIQMVQGYTEAILDGIAMDKADIDEFLYIILDETKRLNRLVNELLNVARIDAGELPMQIESVNTQSFFNKISQNFKKRAEENKIALIMDIDPNIETIPIDYDKMIQVFTNLIDNAMRYTHQNDVITVSAKKERNNLIFKVQDTGVGIAEEHIDQIFERFYKVDQARTRGKHGTGLGLFIVKSIIEHHQGTINVKSKVGQGTTFIIEIPIVDIG
ncbi:ATP-binding protein [Macrococcus sp. DPC7161]|uniref:ATP-binding protein n=1 Tax=Macrococcus sp. DPC7161 TaxID=2507060 RepID=UPI00100A8A82|nr:ATP-binding protein [Macrococcus sp. DPC7161]RXK19298.1 HAMP domain-containing protein [Macrococcus sp. DPC7161]